MKLSIVVPLFNEAESLRELMAELSHATQSRSGAVEFIFVDDGSTDSSWETLVALATQDNRVHALRLRRNFGKSIALFVGFSHSQGEHVVTLDADLQDVPAEIPRLLQALDQGLDVVVGWKRHRQDPFHKTIPSRVFNALVSWATGVRLNDHNSGLKAMRHEVAQSLKLWGDRHRFIPTLASSLGFRVGQIAVEHRSRKFGSSKYGWGRFIRGFVDLVAMAYLIRYRDRPMHFWGTSSLLVGCAGLVSIGASIWWPRWFGWGWCAMVMSVAFFAIGIVLESLREREPPVQPRRFLREQTGKNSATSAGDLNREFPQ
jgi:glycosyltransferase involved in cell wall biosynthesis